MENENNLDFKEFFSNNNVNNYFKIDYLGQRVKGNKNFDKFQKQQLIKHGTDAYLFKCKYCNICFYISNQNCKTFPFYFKECPLCNKNICYFCSITLINDDEDNGNCCVIRKLYYLFFHYGFSYFNGIDAVDEDSQKDFYFVLILSLIPLLGLFIFLALFGGFFYFGLGLGDKKRRDDFNNMADKKTYGDYLSRFYSQNLIITIYVATYIFLTICYYIYDFYFKMLLLIVSIFFKFYPYKYYIGIIVFGIGV